MEYDNSVQISERMSHRRSKSDSFIPYCRTTNHGFKLQQGRFQPNVRKNFVTGRTV